MATFNKISPCLWFDGNAEEAAAFYTKVFDDAEIVRTVRNTPSAMGEEGDVLLHRETAWASITRPIAAISA